jgi:general secretion pathway protein K
LIVIWGLGAIALLVLSFAATGRLRLQTAFNAAGAEQARAMAEAATNLAVLTLAREQIAGGAPEHDGAPSFCALEDAVVALAIEDEAGKIDLNAASEQLVRDAFSGLAGLAPNDAAEVARAVAQFRSPAIFGVTAAPVAGKPFSQKGAQFQSPLELDQVAGLDSARFQALLPFVTVHSHADGLDPHRAPPALFAALLGQSREEVAALAARPYPNALNRDDPRFPENYRQSGAHDIFLVHVEALLANGVRALRETIVDLRANDGAPYALREIRTGEPRFPDQLSAFRAAALPPC